VLPVPKHKYCNGFFPHPRFGNMTSNLVEAINGAFREIRRRPIIEMVEGIWEWMAKKRYERISLEIPTSLAPNAFRCLTDQREETSYTVAVSGTGIATVTGPNRSQFDIDLAKKSCSWGAFFDLQSPCKHALAVIDFQWLHVLVYMHPCYLSERYKLAYGQIVPPIQLKRVGEGETEVVRLAPTTHRGKGRPKTKRNSAGSYRQTRRSRPHNL
jgi:hypothetical protein